MSYFRVSGRQGVHFESIRESEAVAYAQSICATSKGQYIPDVEEVSRTPVDHTKK